jgi:phage baseplate assembly protein W
MPSNTNTRIPSPPIGWPLLPLPQDGALNFPSLEASVNQSIRIILLTQPGEQLMRPTFGAGLQRFLHEPGTLVTRRRIKDAIGESLGLWEPRIIVDRIDVWESEDRPDAVRVEIVYRLKRTGQALSMTLTMNMGT